MSAIGLKTELSEDRSVAVGYSQEHRSFVMQFKKPINDFSRTHDSIVRDHREKTCQLVGDDVIQTTIKLSEEAFLELIRMSNAILNNPI